MEILMSLSALPTPQALFATMIYRRVTGNPPKVVKRGDKYTASGDDFKVVYDAEAGAVTVTQGKDLTKVYKAPKVKATLTTTQGQSAMQIADKIKAELSLLAPKAGPDISEKKIKFAAKSPEKLTKEQATEVKSKYSPALAKKVIALGTALLSIKEVKREFPTSLMFWPFPSGPHTRKVKTQYGTMTRADIFSIMGGTPAVPFKPVGKPEQFRGKAQCRVCGAFLGSATQHDAAGVLRPSAIAVHYKSHGINCNLIHKPVLDKSTGKRYSVLYIGRLSDI